jgi:glutaredoxin 3
MPNKNIVYTRKQHCPYCNKAKELLELHGITFKAIVVGEDIEKDAFVEEIKHLTGNTVTSVPQIFIDGEYVGGYDDLAALPRFSSGMDFDIEL